MKIRLTRVSALLASVAVAVAMSFSSCNNSDAVSQQQIDSLQNRLDSIMEAYNAAKAPDSSRMGLQMASKDSTINAQATEIQNLLNQLNAAKKAQKSNAQGDNSAQLKQQQKQLREKESQIAKLQNQVDKQQKELSKLQKQGNSSDNNAEVARLQRQIREQQNQINDLSDQIENSGKSSNIVSQQCEQDKAELNSQIKSLRQQLADVNIQLKNTQQQNSDNNATAAEVNRLQQQVKSLQNQLTEAQKQAGNIDSKANEVSTAKQELAKCQTTQERLRSQIDVLNSEIALRDTTIEQMKRNVAISKNLTQNVVKVADKTDGQSSAKVKELEGQVENLRKQLKALEDKEADCRKQNSALQKQLTEYQSNYDAAVDKAQQNTNDVSTQLKTLQDKVDALTNENDRLRKAVNDNSSANTIALLQQQLKDQEQQIADLQNQVTAKEAELKAANKNAGKATAGTVNEKLTALQALCDSYVEEIARLKAENEALKAENATLKETNAQAQLVLAQNAELVQKVEQASILVASVVNARAGKSISGTILKETDKASKTKLIMIDAHLLPNNVITPGSITIYARIANAANRVVCNGSPSDLVFDMNGTSMQYTVSQDIEFFGRARDVRMLWRKFDNVTLDPGLYWVTLYANGYEIGKTSFTLE